MPNGKLYTNEEDDIIRQHIGKKSSAEIAEILGRSKLSVQYRVSKLDLLGKLYGDHHPGRKIDSLRAAMVITLGDAGFRPVEILRVMKQPCPVGYTTIYEICQGFSWALAVEAAEKNRAEQDASLRERFEAWASREPRVWYLGRYGDDPRTAMHRGNYKEGHVQAAWEAWLEASIDTGQE